MFDKNLRFGHVYIFLFGLMSIVITSCSDSGEEGVELLLPTLEEYIAQNNLNTQETDSGLHYIIEATGTAPNAELRNFLTVNYKGYLLNGEEFDSGNGAMFVLGQLIQGWQEGLQLIGTGGKITLIIPSELAYGSRGSGSIPPNTDIGFDIELLSIE